MSEDLWIYNVVSFHYYIYYFFVCTKKQQEMHQHCMLDRSLFSTKKAQQKSFLFVWARRSSPCCCFWFVVQGYLVRCSTPLRLPVWTTFGNSTNISSAIAVGDNAEIEQLANLKRTLRILANEWLVQWFQGFLYVQLFAIQIVPRRNLIVPHAAQAVLSWPSANSP